MVQHQQHKRSPEAERRLREENQDLDKSNSRLKAMLWIIIIVAASLVVIFIVVPLVNSAFSVDDDEPAATTYDDFSISYVGILGDGYSLFVVDDSDLDGTLWRVIGGDVDDPYDYRLIKNCTSGLDIDSNDFDGDVLKTGDALVLIVNGTLPYADYDDFLDSSYKSARTIYPQQFRLNPTGSNQIEVYQKFSDAGVVMANSATYTVVTVATPITKAINVTFTIGGNATEKDAMYVRQTGLKTKYCVNLLVEFNATITDSSFSISDMTVSSFNSTALVFEVNSFFSLTSDAESYYGTWASAVASNIKFTKVTLRYGSTVL